VRAAIVFSLCLGLASVAYGQPASVEGTPRDVVAWQPGAYSVASTTQAKLRRADGSTQDFPLLNGVGTFWGTSPTECFVGINQSGTQSSLTNCWGTNNNIIPGDFTFSNVLGVRFTPSGTGYAMARVETSEPRLLMARPGEVSSLPWDVLPVSPVAPLSNVMAVTETDGGVPHALFLTRPNPNTSRFTWFREGQQQAELDVSGTPLAVDLIPTSGPHPIALYAGATGIFRVQLSPSASPIPDAGTPVTLLTDASVSITSLDVNIGGGSELGEGFGLAVGRREGFTDPVVLAAVPAGSAEDAGTVWRIHEGIPFPSGVPAEAVQVSCVGSAYCVIALNRNGSEGDNLVIYTNSTAPVIAGGVGAFGLAEGATSSLLEFSASDGDGDPVRMSLDTSQASALLDVASLTAPPGAMQVRLTAREVCQTTAGTVRVQASDGLRAHDRREDLVITVENTRNPDQPSVQPTETVTYGEPAVFTASPPAPGVCPTMGYAWSPAQPPLSINGGTATFTPSLAVRCTPSGGSFTYEVRGLDPGGLPSGPASFTVNVAPWGQPYAPFGPGARRTLDSRTATSVDLLPEALHICIEDGGVPREQMPLATEWLLNDREGDFADITLRAEDGGLLFPQLSVMSNTLRVEAEECTRARFSLSAQHQLRTSGPPLEGPEATVQVEVEPPLEDFNRAELALAVDPGNDRQVYTGFGASRPDCQRGLQARMVLEALDGRQLATGEVAVPGPWDPPLPNVCAGTYTVRGQLVDQRISPVRQGDQETLTLTVGPRLEALEGDTLVARCGQGVSARLTQPITPAACDGLSISWTQVGAGPRLVDAPLSGESVTLATEASAPLEELVGQSVTVRVTAQTEEGFSSAREHVLPITAEPFVDVKHSLESPTGTETSLLGVVVELRNTTGCEVGNLSYVERPEGLEPVPGSVKLDGRPLPETAVEGGFQVNGVRLAAQATGRLTYVARPRLLTSPRFSGEVFLNQVPVSGIIPPPASSGCGCSGGGSGVAVFGLLALARLLRRRSPRA
jgi:uncharacterized protein (TIGR03382 family)